MAGRPRLSKPKIAASAQKELDKVEEQFKAFDENVKSMTMDNLNKAPKEEVEPQTKTSQKDASKSKEIWLKPKRSLPPGTDPKTGKREEFNEKFRTEYEYQKEYVCFIAENREIVGETIADMWTKPFPGMNCESWDVPVNKPVWGPRFLAEQIKRCRYVRIIMDQKKTTAADGMGTYYGAIAADTIVQRMDAHPVEQRKSIFMGAANF